MFFLASCAVTGGQRYHKVSGLSIIYVQKPCTSPPPSITVCLSQTSPPFISPRDIKIPPPPLHPHHHHTKKHTPIPTHSHDPVWRGWGGKWGPLWVPQGESQDAQPPSFLSLSGKKSSHLVKHTHWGSSWEIGSGDVSFVLSFFCFWYAFVDFRSGLFDVSWG